MTPDERTPVVARVRRGAFVESEHRGAVAVSDGSGRLVSRVGNASQITALRSSAKPFQLLPIITSGAADAFGFAPDELAVMAGSHAGRPEHVQAVRSALEKAGVDENALLCGAHVPFDGGAAENLFKAGRLPTPLHNNCSGKHAGMLALAKFLGEPLGSYLNPDGAAQKAIHAAVAWAAGIDESALGVAVDGCSAPTFFVPLSSASAAFARLAAARGGDARSEALARIRDAMMSHPALVAGPGRFDTMAMQSMPGLCAKGGAEGVQGMSLRLADGRVVGIAVKIFDGGGRAAGPVALEALRALAGELPAALEIVRAPVMKNHRGTEVGRLEPVVALTDA